MRRVVSDKYLASIKTLWKMFQSQNYKKNPVWLERKYIHVDRIAHSASGINAISFHCRKYQFYSHLIWIEFTAKHKVNDLYISSRVSLNNIYFEDTKHVLTKQ